MSTLKLSVTVEREVAKALRAKVASRNVSRFVNIAIRHELEREQMRALLAELENELGPPDSEMVREADDIFERLATVATKKAARPKRVAKRNPKSRTRG